MELQTYTVSELNTLLKAFVDSEELIHNICVFGEISNYKVYRSGHHYFTLKDAEASIRCVMYKYSAVKMKFRPEDGMQCAVFGSISLYKADGGLQLVCSNIRPMGMGDLHFAFEQLKSRLYAEGLFDKSHKKPLPLFPKCIAVITSGDGAAVHDIIRITGARWPLAEIKVIPVHVQGELASPEICDAIEKVNRFDLADVIITGRGGGSLEDLWAFNEESVVRAIYGSRIPVISAVGHEPDVTIADFVADARASTPSNAAEICVPDSDEIRQGIDSLSARLSVCIQDKISALQNELNHLSSSRVLKNPEEYVSLKKLELGNLQTTFLHCYEKILQRHELCLSKEAAALDAMSPLKVLARGYTLAEKNGKTVRSVHQLNPNDELVVFLQDGHADCTIQNIHLLGD